MLGNRPVPTVTNTLVSSDDKDQFLALQTILANSSAAAAAALQQADLSDPAKPGVEKGN